MPVFQFDDVKVDTRTFRVYKAGQPAQMEPKAFEVLVYLIENRGRLVEKRELLDSIWKNTFVTENALTREVALLRKALAEDAKSARYIETVPTKGYRFIANVHEVTDGQAPGCVGERIEQSQHRSPQPSKLPALAAIAAAILVIALAYFAFLRSHGRTEKKAEVVNISQVTTSGGLSIFPGISPDGSSVAYAAERKEAFEIYIKQLSPGGGELQLTNDGQQNLEPAWSPNGRFIAYSSLGRGGIWLVGALGGAPRQLADFGSRPAWSADGRKIVFESKAGGGFDVDSPDAFPPSVLWSVDVDTGALHQITQLGHPRGGHGAPAWSPDDKRIVFTSSDYRTSEIWSVAADGSDLKILAPSGQTYYNSPIFSRSGHSIFFAGVRSKFNYGVWQLALSSSNAAVGEPVEVASGGALRIKHLSLSLDGRHLLYSVLTQDSNLTSVTVDRFGTAFGPPHPLTNSTSCRNTLPSYSPDGQWLAYISCRAGANASVWVMRADGSGARQLTTGAADHGFPNWFADNEKVAFVSTRDGRQKIWTVSAKTEREEPLFESQQQIGFFRLSPDGEKIVFDSNVAGKLRVFVANLSDKTTRQFTPDGLSMGFPSWSPDGRWIALELQQNDESQLGYMPSDGGAFTQLTAGHGDSWTGGWSPDNDHILFAGRRNGVWNVYSISRTTRKTDKITTYSELNEYVRYPVWSPKGDQIAYEYAKTTGNIWMLDLK